MARVLVNEIEISYEIIGSGNRSAIITPGGRFSKDTEGVRELAERIAEGGFRVVIWDRPNCGGSDACFVGETESIVNADTLAGLLRTLDLSPALVVGGSAGARASLIAAARHPGVVDRMFLLWIAGGLLPTMILAYAFYLDSWTAAAGGGMKAVADLPMWQEAIRRNPRNRDIILRQDPVLFMRTMDAWSASFIPRPESPVPDVLPAQFLSMTMPVAIVRSAEADRHHPRATADAVHAAVPGSLLLDPPWGEREWHDRMEAAARDNTGLCVNWPLLAPQILDFSRAE